MPLQCLSCCACRRRGGCRPAQQAAVLAVAGRMCYLLHEPACMSGCEPAAAVSSMCQCISGRLSVLTALQKGHQEYDVARQFKLLNRTEVGSSLRQTDHHAAHRQMSFISRGCTNDINMAQHCMHEISARQAVPLRKHQDSPRLQALSQMCCLHILPRVGTHCARLRCLRMPVYCSVHRQAGCCTAGWPGQQLQHLCCLR